MNELDVFNKKQSALELRKESYYKSGTEVPYGHPANYTRLETFPLPDGRVLEKGDLFKVRYTSGWYKFLYASVHIHDEENISIQAYGGSINRDAYNAYRSFHPEHVTKIRGKSDGLPPVNLPAIKVPESQRKCVVCGVQLVKTSARGRWPTRCPSCKESGAKPPSESEQVKPRVKHPRSTAEPAPVAASEPAGAPSTPEPEPVEQNVEPEPSEPEVTKLNTEDEGFMFVLPARKKRKK